MKPQPANKAATTTVSKESLAAKKTTGVPLKQSTLKNTSPNNILFTRENYKWMLIGLAILALGFFLMAGGKSSNPQVFNDKDVYSPMRITIAPILIIAGLLVEIYAIMKKPKQVI